MYCINWYLEIFNKFILVGLDNENLNFRGQAISAKRMYKQKLVRILILQQVNWMLWIRLVFTKLIFMRILKMKMFS